MASQIKRLTNGNRAVRSGFTLLELTAVLIILVLLAAMILPLIGGSDSVLSINVGGGKKSAKQIVTETTMRTIRDAIMGTGNQPGAWSDLGNRPDLFPNDPNVLLRHAHATIGDFNPVTKIGWRGPYLSAGTELIDAWGNPLQIRLDYNADTMISEPEVRYVALVSWGPNGVRDFLQHPDALTDSTQWKSLVLTGTEPDDETVVMSESRGDDIVLFFRTADTQP